VKVVEVLKIVKGSDMVIPHIAAHADEKADDDAKATDQQRRCRPRTRSQGSDMVIPHIAAHADDAKATDQQRRSRPPTRSTHDMTSDEVLAESKKLYDELEATRANHARDLAKALIDSEVDPIHVKHAEMDRIAAQLLRPKDLVIVPQKRDGSCLFNSLADALDTSPQECRRLAVEFVSIPKHFEFFAPVDKTDQRDETIEAYGVRMRQDQGDVAELVALGTLFKRPVVLSKVTFISGEQPQLTSETYMPRSDIDVENECSDPSSTTIHLVLLTDPKNLAHNHYHLCKPADNSPAPAGPADGAKAPSSK
jgi:hypothetical protein